MEILQGESWLFDPLFIDVEDAHCSYPEEFTITLHESENYLLEDDLLIIPDPAFSGVLLVPVVVNNGYQSSDPFAFEILVDADTQIPEAKHREEVTVHYDKLSGQLVILLTADLYGKPIELYLFTSSGSEILQRQLSSRPEIRQTLPEMPAGVYIVHIRGAANKTTKIIIP